jgi:hypothetical protein
MKLIQGAACVLLAVILLAIFGCATADKTVSGQPTSAATTVQVTVTLQGMVPAGISINTVDLTLNLPPGVTAKAAPSGLTADGVVVPSGVAQGALAAARFIPAAGPQPAQIRLALVRVAGFGPGEIATFHLDLNGHVLQPGEFSVAGLKVTDARGATISGLDATLGLLVK